MTNGKEKEPEVNHHLSNIKIIRFLSVHKNQHSLGTNQIVVAASTIGGEIIRWHILIHCDD